MGMDRTSINSLNSKRNLKLPPIQGAVPAAVYGERSWNTNNKKSISQQHHQRPRIKNDLVHANNFRSLNRVDLNSSVDFPRQKAAVFTSPRQHVPVQINLGHEFPKSYTVLPPINNLNNSAVARPRRSSRKNIGHVDLSIEGGKRPVKKETKPQPKSCARTADELSERRRERLQEKLKAAESKENISNAENIKTVDDTKNITTSTNDNHDGNNNGKEEEKDAVPRKRSPTFLEHMKCKRFGRRHAVCLDNEPTLVNVTDQLKEIFLRRNMEEMYLI